MEYNIGVTVQFQRLFVYFLNYNSNYFLRLAFLVKKIIINEIII